MSIDEFWKLLLVTLVTISMCIVAICALCHTAEAAHWIVGDVADTNETTGVNKTVRMYFIESPENYVETTTSLLEGNIDVSRWYMLDVQMIPNSEQFYTHNWISMYRTVCIEVINNGDGYVSTPIRVLINTFHYTLAPTIQLRKV